MKIKSVLCFRRDCLTSPKAETPRLWQIAQLRHPFDPGAGRGPAGAVAHWLEYSQNSESRFAWRNTVLIILWSEQVKKAPEYRPSAQPPTSLVHL